ASPRWPRSTTRMVGALEMFRCSRPRLRHQLCNAAANFPRVIQLVPFIGAAVAILCAEQPQRLAHRPAAVSRLRMAKSAANAALVKFLAACDLACDRGDRR